MYSPVEDEGRGVENPEDREAYILFNSYKLQTCELVIKIEDIYFLNSNREIIRNELENLLPMFPVGDGLIQLHLMRNSSNSVDSLKRVYKKLIPMILNFQNMFYGLLVQCLDIKSTNVVENIF